MSLCLGYAKSTYLYDFPKSALNFNTVHAPKVKSDTAQH